MALAPGLDIWLYAMLMTPLMAFLMLWLLIPAIQRWLRFKALVASAAIRPASCAKARKAQAADAHQACTVRCRCSPSPLIPKRMVWPGVR